LEALKKTLMLEISNVSARIDAAAYSVRGRWFRTLDDCIAFSRLHIPEGQFQWFLDIVSFLQFTTDVIIDTDESQRGEIHEARVKRTQEQSTVIASFRTGVPPIFGGPKSQREATDPYSAIKTPEKWNGHDYQTGVFPRAVTSLADQTTKIEAGISWELGAHLEASALATTLLAKSENCFAKLGAGVEAFYKYLLTTTYGRDPSKIIAKAAQEECWTVAKKYDFCFLCGTKPSKSRSRHRLHLFRPSCACGPLPVAHFAGSQDHGPISEEHLSGASVGCS
jgi:hypothetical protein